MLFNTSLNNENTWGMCLLYSILSADRFIENWYFQRSVMYRDFFTNNF